MPGETDLNKLIKEMKPVLNPGEFVFSMTTDRDNSMLADAIGIFQEKEGITMILPKQIADQAKPPYLNTFAWITLTVHSSLEAVGLTAVVSQALRNANISCNVVAAYYHDHIFVPTQDAKRAMEVLLQLTNQENK